MSSKRNQAMTDPKSCEPSSQAPHEEHEEQETDHLSSEAAEILSRFQLPRLTKEEFDALTREDLEEYCRSAVVIKARMRVIL